LLFTVGMVSQTSNMRFLTVSEGIVFLTVKRFDNQTRGAFYNDGNAYICSHFNNDGIVDFYGTTGLICFL